MWVEPALLRPHSRFDDVSFGGGHIRLSDSNVEHSGVFASRSARAHGRYDHFEDNPFVRVASELRSTFSIDVDTASYAQVRHFLQYGELPPEGAVRIEDLVNYFSYEYSEPDGDHPFAVFADVSDAPWAPEHRLVRIGRLVQRLDARDRVSIVVYAGAPGLALASDERRLSERPRLRHAGLSGRDAGEARRQG